MVPEISVCQVHCFLVLKIDILPSSSSQSHCEREGGGEINNDRQVSSPNLSGVNFHALRSFCACSNFSLYCLSCFFIEENMILTAGSTISE